MTLATRVLEWLCRPLPPACTRDVMVERKLRVPMPDGVELLADRYFPRGIDRPPIVLVRTPYRRTVFGVLMSAGIPSIICWIAVALYIVNAVLVMAIRQTTVPTVATAAAE